MAIIELQHLRKTSAFMTTDNTNFIRNQLSKGEASTRTWDDTSHFLKLFVFVGY